MEVKRAHDKALEKSTIYGWAEDVATSLSPHLLEMGGVDIQATFFCLLFVEDNYSIEAACASSMTFLFLCFKEGTLPPF